MCCGSAQTVQRLQQRRSGAAQLNLLQPSVAVPVQQPLVVAALVLQPKPQGSLLLLPPSHPLETGRRQERLCPLYRPCHRSRPALQARTYQTLPATGLMGEVWNTWLLPLLPGPLRPPPMASRVLVPEPLVRC